VELLFADEEVVDEAVLDEEVVDDEKVGVDEEVVAESFGRQLQASYPDPLGAHTCVPRTDPHRHAARVYGLQLWDWLLTPPQWAATSASPKAAAGQVNRELRVMMSVLSK
jgi:hypothetical protein